MFKLALGGNILALINSDPKRIIDIGAGSGIWDVEVAKEYPSANVIGFDLSPISRKQVPANCTFEVGDLTLDLGRYPEGTFDLVHSRNISCGVSHEQWRAFGAEIMRMLKPGGWAQCTESSPPQWDTEFGPEESDWAKFALMLRTYCEERNLPLDGSHLEKILLDAGFAEVRVTKRVVPIGMAREPYKDSPARVVGTEAFSGAVRGFVEYPKVDLSRWFPEELEGTISVERRRQFGEHIAVHMQHYPLYLTIYSVVGRKSREGA